ncbi:hypothetical protein V0R50_21300 [Pseudomonas sp. 148P]|uniref:Uncharacterized protein n=1 Tax=Pseudomonas ulcerans TaxID=3115852 RepID=A0ABU7HWA9_9PSED|nr:MULTISPECIES: hypothetical protein [unclassified Pseudomonas]MEE1922924.1 hypothetical protein [Pseudomonas sp. 147P]MEE1935774.1 hypothetical protein [Pseudomonas sp. 148P]
MSYRARRRELKVSPKMLPLIVGVALGLWLGFVAIGLTLWGAWQFLPQVREPVTAVLSQPLAPPPLPATPRQPPSARMPGAAEQSPEQNHMFEQYQQALQTQQIQDAEARAEENLRNLSSPRCQFWLQQNRTAPTEKSRANVLEFCR